MKSMVIGKEFVSGHSKKTDRDFAANVVYVTHKKHLTYTDRLKIEALYREKLPKKQIASALDTSYPTICREIKRGKCTLIDYELRPYETYSADVAQDDYDKKSRYKGRSEKLGNNHDFASFIEKCISKHKYSVDAALSAAESVGYDFTVSRTTLYRYIDLGYLGITNKNLPQGKRNVKRKNTPNGKPQGVRTEVLSKELYRGMN